MDNALQMNKIKLVANFANKYSIGVIISVLSMIANMIIFSATENYPIRNMLLGVFFVGLFLAITGAVSDCF